MLTIGKIRLFSDLQRFEGEDGNPEYEERGKNERSYDNYSIS